MTLPCLQVHQDGQEVSANLMRLTTPTGRRFLSLTITIGGVQLNVLGLSLKDVDQLARHLSWGYQDIFDTEAPCDVEPTIR